MRLTQIERREFCRYLSWYDFKPYLQGKTFLVTGSKGIVGSGVIKWLLLENEQYDTNIRIIASTRNSDKKPSYIDSHDSIEYCRFGEEQAFCRGRHIDYIVHAAAGTDNSYHAAHPAESLRVIIDGTERMLDTAREHDGCSMIYISSEEVYGLPETEEPLRETYVGAIDSLAQRSCYPLGKKAAELLCYTYAAEYGTDVKIIRPTCIQGLLQRYDAERVINEILRCMLENKDLVLKSAGLTKKCFMYSLDAVSAIFTVLFRGAKGEAYNASAPDTFIAVKDLAGAVFTRFKPELKVEFQKTDTSVAAGYLPKRTLLQSIEKISALGWSPRADMNHIYSVDIERFQAEKEQEQRPE